MSEHSSENDSVDSKSDVEDKKPVSKRKRGRPSNGKKGGEIVKKRAAKKKRVPRATVKSMGIGTDQISFLKELFYKMQNKYIPDEDHQRIISKDAVFMLENLKEVLLNGIINKIQELVSTKKKDTIKTLNAKIAYQAIRLYLPQDVQKKVSDRSLNAILKFRTARAQQEEQEEQEDQTQDVAGSDFADENVEEEGKGHNTFAKTTGHVLRHTRISGKLKERCSFNRFSPEASIVITVSIEFIMEKVILMTLLYALSESTGTPDSQGKIRQKKITSSDIRRAVEAYDKTSENVLCSARVGKKDLPDTFGGEGIAHTFSNVIWTQTKSSIPVLAM